MKTTITICLSLLLGIIVGTVYGWRTGYTDGVVQSRINLTVWLPRARALSTDPKLNKQFDTLAAATAGIFAEGHSNYSPMMFSFNPKSEAGLSEMLVYRMLFSPDLPLDKFSVVAALGASEAFAPPPLQKIKDRISLEQSKLDKFFKENPEKLEQKRRQVEQGATANP